MKYVNFFKEKQVEAKEKERREKMSIASGMTNAGVPMWSGIMRCADMGGGIFRHPAS